MIKYCSIFTGWDIPVLDTVCRQNIKPIQQLTDFLQISLSNEFMRINGLLFSMKSSENQKFSDYFSGNRS